MNSYEGLFVFPPESSPEARKTQLKTLDDLIQKFEGEILQKTEWGKKPLGYPIRKFHEGYFLVADFKMNPAKAGEFRRGLELLEDLIKFMVVAKCQKTEKQAAAKTAAAASSKTTKSAGQPQAASQS